MEGEMNRFVHRILKSSTATSIGGTTKLSPTQQLVQTELQHAKLLYFGEFHSEERVVSFQTELIKEWAKCLASSYSSSLAGRSSSTVTVEPQPPRLHLIMEHFSVDMQNLLDRFAGVVVVSEKPSPDDDNEAFEELKSSYKNDFGTEGHDLQPYRNLLQLCRQTTRNGRKGMEHYDYCPIHIHGGFIPRNHAARLNKECPDTASKQSFFDEMSNQRGYLPRHEDPMYKGLFEDGLNYKLQGSREHRLLIESLMSGADLYSPSEMEDNLPEEEEVDDGESPIPRLIQAQLLKDHAMGYRIASLMLQHYDDQACGRRSLSSDRYVVIAGFGHLKHYLGVPECVNRYLRQEALMHPNEHRRSAAIDLLLSISCSPPPHATNGNSFNMKFGGNGTALIGCQMMYEAYLEDSYPPMLEARKASKDGDDDDDDDEINEDVQRKLLKQLYLRNPKLMDDYILKSHEVSGPLLHYANGSAGFAHPCADYLFVYDEDDDNIIDESDLAASDEESNTCPSHNRANGSSKSNNNDDVKDETIKAYEQIGKTAYMRGNVSRARAIMSQLGYTDDDMNNIGDDDIYNFQGVANPHTVAKIQVGESVLDIGSGLGIDSFIAMRDCGAENNLSEVYDDLARPRRFVVGVDISQSEVNHAMKRASARGYSVPRGIQFIRGDVEKLEEALLTKNVPMEMFDVCISNGAFCLVPDKTKAFTNVFKALKSGGRMAISTTTIVSESLDPEFEWPVCMRMFASLNSIKDMCESIGFKNVNVIDAESPMEGMELPVDENESTNTNDDAAVGNGERKRFKIHGRYADQYEFLEKMNMDELCKVVTVYGEKP